MATKRVKFSSRVSPDLLSISHDLILRQQLCVDLPEDRLHGCRQCPGGREGALGHGLVLDPPQCPFDVVQCRVGAARSRLGLPDPPGP